MFIAKAEKFAEHFNRTVPGAYRKVSTEDIKDMADCGLIARYGFYVNQDLQTVIGILRYEKLWQNRQRRMSESTVSGQCKICGMTLPQEPEGKKGRPREYCDNCEASRLKDRNRKWRDRKRKAKRKSKISLATRC